MACSHILCRLSIFGHHQKSGQKERTKDPARKMLIPEKIAVAGGKSPAQKRPSALNMAKIASTEQQRSSLTAAGWDRIFFPSLLLVLRCLEN
jgi:hypothetical protein